MEHMKHLSSARGALAIALALCTSLLVIARSESAAADTPDAKSPSTRPVRVVVWDEQQPQQKQAYDNFLGNAIADHLKSKPGFTVRSVNLDDPEQGLSRRGAGRVRRAGLVGARPEPGRAAGDRQADRRADQGGAAVAGRRCTRPTGRRRSSRRCTSGRARTCSNGHPGERAGRDEDQLRLRRSSTPSPSGTTRSPRPSRRKTGDDGKVELEVKLPDLRLPRLPRRRQAEPRDHAPARPPDRGRDPEAVGRPADRDVRRAVPRPRSPTRWSSRSAGTPASISAAGACGTSARERSSTSGRGTRRTRSTGRRSRCA